MNEHMSTSRDEQLKHIESKVQRYNRSLKQPGNHSMPSQKVKGVSSNGIIIVFIARIDDLIGKVAHELLTSPRGRNNFGTGVCRRVRFRSCGTVGYGPTMWVFYRSSDILHGHDSKACQRVPCQLCRQHVGTKGEGRREPFSCSLKRGGPLGKVLVHRWLPKCHQQ